MAYKQLAIVLGMVAIASPLSANSPDPVPMAAPAGTPDTRYCMRVEAPTGSRIEPVRCWTRLQWAEQEVDVDAEWAKEGVAVIG